MKIFKGPVHGLLETPQNPWAAVCRIDTLDIDGISLKRLKVPRRLYALLARAGPTETCTLYLMGRLVVGLGLHGHTYYCEPAIGLRAGLTWGGVAVAGLMLIPDANASFIARLMLAGPFVFMMLSAVWTHRSLRPLRARQDAVPL